MKAPAYGWQDHEEPEQRRLGPGHHCEVFVLARHTGRDIHCGWTFAALPTRLVEEAKTRGGNLRRTITPVQVDAWGLQLVGPEGLREAVAAATECG